MIDALLNALTYYLQREQELTYMNVAKGLFLSACAAANRWLRHAYFLGHVRH